MGLFNEVNDLRQLCDRRAMEINHLAYQMKDFAVHLAAQGKNADPNVVAILKAKVNELLPRQALAMHGTADALATVSEEVSSKLRPIAEKIDAFRRNPSAVTHSRFRDPPQRDRRSSSRTTRRASTWSRAVFCSPCSPPSRTTSDEAILRGTTDIRLVRDARCPSV